MRLNPVTPTSAPKRADLVAEVNKATTIAALRALLLKLIARLMP